jgi:hypothetical protein
MVTARRTTPDVQHEEIVPEEATGAITGTVPARARVGARSRPSFGPEYWFLGLAASLPALLGALALLACAGLLPLVPELPVGIALGGLLLLLAIGAIFAHAADYPAWTHPGVALVPILALFLPAAVLRGQALTPINGDTDLVVAAPLAISWLLMVASVVVAAIVACAVGRHAPSFSGLAVLPVPLILAWLLILAPPFQERAVIGALGSALALAALATFAAWVVPAGQRPFVPLAAIGAQFGIFWLQRFHWPTFNGVVRPVVALDIALYVGLVALVAVLPFCAAWVRRSAWSAALRLLG